MNFSFNKIAFYDRFFEPRESSNSRLFHSANMIAIRPWISLPTWCLAISISPVFIQYLQAQTDQPSIMPYGEFLEYVKLHHPILKQAKLLTDLANEGLRMERGNFDPKAMMDYDEKKFKNSQYYYYWNSQLKIPTWIGTDFKLGYERNDGPFLNSEFNTDAGKGYYYAGVSVPVGQGLFMDARRAVLRQAQAMQTYNQAEKVKLTNKTILEATKDYWFWFFKYHEVRLLTSAYQLANERFSLVKISAAQGDMSLLDTIEAKIAVQNRELNLRLAENELKNARLFLSVHLWQDAQTPLELSPNIVPPSSFELKTDTINIVRLFDFAKMNHPELVKLTAKARQLEVDRRLASENIKPLIYLDYTTLLGQHAQQRGLQVAMQDYKLAARFSMPLLLRKERGKLQMSKIKIEQNQYELSFESQKILNELNAAYNDFQILSQLIGNQSEIVENYKNLTEGEMLRFVNGDSPFFMVNLREGVYFESQVKLFDMQHKLGKSVATLLWSAGVGY